MNTDQGSQITSFASTDRLRRSNVRISIDGKGRLLDNIFVERLWPSTCMPGKPDQRLELASENGSRFTTTGARILRLVANHLP
jgi:transposase InsO family protein